LRTLIGVGLQAIEDLRSRSLIGSQRHCWWLLRAILILRFFRWQHSTHFLSQ
jgi:hypothetical protein